MSFLHRKSVSGLYSLLRLQKPLPVLFKVQLRQVLGAKCHGSKVIVEKGLGPGQAEEEQVQEIPDQGEVVVDQVAWNHAAPEFSFGHLFLPFHVLLFVCHQVKNQLTFVLNDGRQIPPLSLHLLMEQHQVDRSRVFQLPGQREVLQRAHFKPHQQIAQSQPHGGVYLLSGKSPARLPIGESNGRLGQHIPAAQQGTAAHFLHGKSTKGALGKVIVVISIVEINLVGPPALPVLYAAQNGDEGVNGLLGGTVYGVVRQKAHAEGNLGKFTGLGIVIALPVRQQGIPGLGGIPEAQQGAGGWLRGGHKAAPAPEQDQTVVDHQAGDPFLFKLLKQLLQQLRRDGLPLKVQAGHTGALHMQAAA